MLQVLCDPTKTDHWFLPIWWTLQEHRIKIKHDAWLIAPLRRYDMYLMEAMNEFDLTTQQLEQINACHMFLQVTTLAEIVDHMGTMLLLHVLKPSNQEMPIGLSSLSTSNLQWPTIHPPSPTSWRLWNQTISNLFTGTPMAPNSPIHWASGQQTTKSSKPGNGIFHPMVASYIETMWQPQHVQPHASLCNAPS